jgi:DNA invertase Pin-like site-specific DNA recombinase
VITLTSDTDAPHQLVSKLVFTILSAVAEAERDRIRERVTQVKQDQKDRGRYLGGKVPFGFRVADDGGLLPDAVQQALIAHARTLRSRGATLRSIQTALAAQHGRKLRWTRCTECSPSVLRRSCARHRRIRIP